MRPQSRRGGGPGSTAALSIMGLWSSLCPETQPVSSIPLPLPHAPSSLSLGSSPVLSVPWKLQLISAALGSSHPTDPPFGLCHFSASLSLRVIHLPQIKFQTGQVPVRALSRHLGLDSSFWNILPSIQDLASLSHLLIFRLGDK